MEDPFNGPKMLKQGWINKKGGKRGNWNKRYLVASSDGLKYYAKENADLKGSVSLSDIIEVISATHPKREFVFHVETAARTYVIETTDKDTRASWINVIKALKEYAKPNLSRLDAFGYDPTKTRDPILFSSAPLSGTGEVVAVTLDKKRVSSWSVEDVKSWIRTLGLKDDWSRLITEGAVDGEILLEDLRRPNDWEELGIPSRARDDINRLITAVNELPQA
jgi:hypothetical protein